MHSARHGDYGPLVAGVVIAMIALMPLLDIKGRCRALARRVIARSELHRGMSEDFGYWVVRATGLCGLLLAALLIFAAGTASSRINRRGIERRTA